MLNPALAAAILGVSAWRKLMYSLIWQSVTWRPGKLRFLNRREEPASYPADRDRQKTRPLAGPRRSPDSRLQSGYALLPSRIRRHFLTLIAALFSSCLPRSSRRGGQAPGALPDRVDAFRGALRRTRVPSEHRLPGR